MLQSNQICMKQQRCGQPDTGDFVPLSSESWRGQFKVRIQSENALSLTKPIIKLIYQLLIGCCNFPHTCPNVSPNITLKFQHRSEITNNCQMFVQYVLAFIYITWR